MTTPTHARLLDPRWHQIADAARQFYDQLEPGDEVIGVNIVITGEDQQCRAYLMIPGETSVRCSLITDLDAVERVMQEASIDVTPEAGDAA